MCTKSGVIVKLDGQHVVAFPIKCHSWGCPDCSKDRRRQLINEARSGKPNRFITLTVNPNWFDSPEDRAARLSKAWRLVVAAYRHRWPDREAEYLAVFEATEKGEPHLHIVWRGAWMPQKWLSKQMAKRMGAPVVDIRRVRDQKKVIEYVSKYISKRNIKFGNLKRYWRSKHYLNYSPSKERRKRNEGCYFFRSGKHYTYYLEWVIKLGWTVTVSSTGTFEFDLPPGVTFPPWWFLPEGTLCEAKAA